ncbi:hypothetical protein PQX77_002594, partial [Marasmius sp. AFHP31]
SHRSSSLCCSWIAERGNSFTTTTHTSFYPTLTPPPTFTMLKQADTYIEMLVDMGFGYDRILSLLDNPGFYNLLYSTSFTHLLHRFPLENLSHYARKFLVKMTTNSSILEELTDGDLVSFTVDLLEKKLEHINSLEEHNKPISTRQLSPSYRRRPHEPMSLRPGSSPSHGPTTVHPVTTHPTSTPAHSISVPEGNSAIPCKLAIASQYPLRSMVTQSVDPFNSTLPSRVHPRSTTVAQSALNTLTADTLVVPQGSSTLQPKPPSHTLPVLSTLPCVNEPLIDPGSAINSQVPQCRTSHTSPSSGFLTPNETVSSYSPFTHGNDSTIRSQPTSVKHLYKPNIDAIQRSPKSGFRQNTLNSQFHVSGGKGQRGNHERRSTPYLRHAPHCTIDCTFTPSAFIPECFTIPTSQTPPLPSGQSSRWTIRNHSVESQQTEATHVGENFPRVSETSTLVYQSSPDWWDRDWSSDSLFSSDNEEDDVDETSQYSESEFGTPYGDAPYRNYEPGKPEDPEIDNPRSGCPYDLSYIWDGVSQQSDDLENSPDDSPEPGYKEKDVHHLVGPDEIGCNHDLEDGLSCFLEEDNNSIYDRNVEPDYHFDSGTSEHSNEQEALPEDGANPEFEDDDNSVGDNGEVRSHFDDEEPLFDERNSNGFEFDDQASRHSDELEIWPDDSTHLELEELGDDGLFYESGDEEEEYAEYDDGASQCSDELGISLDEENELYPEEYEEYNDSASQHSDNLDILAGDEYEQGSESPADDHEFYEDEADQYEYGNDENPDTYLVLVSQDFPRSLWSLQRLKHTRQLLSPKHVTSYESEPPFRLRNILIDTLSSFPFFAALGIFESFLQTTRDTFLQTLRLSCRFIVSLEDTNAIVNYGEHLRLLDKKEEPDLERLSTPLALKEWSLQSDCFGILDEEAVIRTASNQYRNRTMAVDCNILVHPPDYQQPSNISKSTFSCGDRTQNDTLGLSLNSTTSHERQPLILLIPYPTGLAPQKRPHTILEGEAVISMINGGRRVFPICFVQNPLLPIFEWASRLHNSFEHRLGKLSAKAQVLYLEEGVGLSPSITSAHTCGNPTFSITIGNHQSAERLTQTRNRDIPMWNTSFLLMTARLKPHRSCVSVPQITVPSDVSIPFGFLDKLADNMVSLVFMARPEVVTVSLLGPYTFPVSNVARPLATEAEIVNSPVPRCFQPLEPSSIILIPLKNLPTLIVTHTTNHCAWRSVLIVPIDGVEVFMLPNKFLFMLVSNRKVTLWLDDTPCSGVHIPSIPYALKVSSSNKLRATLRLHLPIADFSQVLPFGISSSPTASSNPPPTISSGPKINSKMSTPKVVAKTGVLQSLYSHKDGRQERKGTRGRHGGGIPELTPISACHSGHSPSTLVQRLPKDPIRIEFKSPPQSVPRQNGTTSRRKNRRLKGGVKTLALTISVAHFFFVFILLIASVFEFQGQPVTPEILDEDLPHLGHARTIGGVRSPPFLHRNSRPSCLPPFYSFAWLFANNLSRMVTNSPTPTSVPGLGLENLALNLHEERLVPNPRVSDVSPTTSHLFTCTSKMTTWAFSTVSLLGIWDLPSSKWNLHIIDESSSDTQANPQSQPSNAPFRASSLHWYPLLCYLHLSEDRQLPSSRKHEINSPRIESRLISITLHPQLSLTLLICEDADSLYRLRPHVELDEEAVYDTASNQFLKTSPIEDYNSPLYPSTCPTRFLFFSHNSSHRHLPSVISYHSPGPIEELTLLINVSFDVPLPTRTYSNHSHLSTVTSTPTLTYNGHSITPNISCPGHQSSIEVPTPIHGYSNNDRSPTSFTQYQPTIIRAIAMSIWIGFGLLFAGRSRRSGQDQVRHIFVPKQIPSVASVMRGQLHKNSGPPTMSDKPHLLLVRNRTFKRWSKDPPCASIPNSAVSYSFGIFLSAQIHVAQHPHIPLVDSSQHSSCGNSGDIQRETNQPRTNLSPMSPPPHAIFSPNLHPTILSWSSGCFSPQEPKLFRNVARLQALYWREDDGGSRGVTHGRHIGGVQLLAPSSAYLSVHPAHRSASDPTPRTGRSLQWPLLYIAQLAQDTQKPSLISFLDTPPISDCSPVVAKACISHIAQHNARLRVRIITVELRKREEQQGQNGTVLRRKNWRLKGGVKILPPLLSAAHFFIVSPPFSLLPHSNIGCRGFSPTSELPPRRVDGVRSLCSPHISSRPSCLFPSGSFARSFTKRPSRSIMTSPNPAPALWLMLETISLNSYKRRVVSTPRASNISPLHISSTRWGKTNQLPTFTFGATPTEQEVSTPSPLHQRHSITREAAEIAFTACQQESPATLFLLATLPHSSCHIPQHSPITWFIITQPVDSQRNARSQTLFRLILKMVLRSANSPPSGMLYAASSNHVLPRVVIQYGTEQLEQRGYDQRAMRKHAPGNIPPKTSRSAGWLSIGWFAHPPIQSPSYSAPDPRRLFSASCLPFCYDRLYLGLINRSPFVRLWDVDPHRTAYDYSHSDLFFPELDPCIRSFENCRTMALLRIDGHANKDHWRIEPRAQKIHARNDGGVLSSVLDDPPIASNLGIDENRVCVLREPSARQTVMELLSNDAPGFPNRTQSPLLKGSLDVRLPVSSNRCDFVLWVLPTVYTTRRNCDGTPNDLPTRAPIAPPVALISTHIAPINCIRPGPFDPPFDGIQSAVFILVTSPFDHTTYPSLISLHYDLPSESFGHVGQPVSPIPGTAMEQTIQITEHADKLSANAPSSTQFFSSLAVEHRVTIRDEVVLVNSNTSTLKGALPTFLTAIPYVSSQINNSSPSIPHNFTPRITIGSPLSDDTVPRFLPSYTAPYPSIPSNVSSTCAYNFNLTLVYDQGEGNTLIESLMMGVEEQEWEGLRDKHTSLMFGDQCPFRRVSRHKWPKLCRQLFDTPPGMLVQGTTPKSSQS